MLGGSSSNPPAYKKLNIETVRSNTEEKLEIHEITEAFLLDTSWDEIPSPSKKHEVTEYAEEKFSKGK